ncbi:hypothetical protein CTA2_12665, partial [Colletotrichum tanaceti]
TVNKYSRKAAIVQTGWRTQLVSDPPEEKRTAKRARLASIASSRGGVNGAAQLLSIVALSIVGACAVLLVIAKITANAQKGESSHAAVYAAGHVLK